METWKTPNFKEPSFDSSTAGPAASGGKISLRIRRATENFHDGTGRPHLGPKACRDSQQLLQGFEGERHAPFTTSAFSELSFLQLWTVHLS